MSDNIKKITTRDDKSVRIANIDEEPANLKDLYNTVFSLIEEELYQRLNPESYNDNVFDGSLESICGSSNLDLDRLDRESRSLSPISQQFGGQNIHQLGSANLVPGKFDAVRNSYQIPLDVAIKGTIDRQRLFLKERNSKH